MLKSGKARRRVQRGDDEWKSLHHLALKSAAASSTVSLLPVDHVLLSPLSEKAVHPIDSGRRVSHLPVPPELVHVLAEHVARPEGEDEVVELGLVAVAVALAVAVVVAVVAVDGGGGVAVGGGEGGAQPAGGALFPLQRPHAKLLKIKVLATF